MDSHVQCGIKKVTKFKFRKLFKKKAHKKISVKKKTILFEKI